MWQLAPISWNRNILSNCYVSHQKHLLLALKNRIIRDDRGSVAAKVMRNNGEEFVGEFFKLVPFPLLYCCFNLLQSLKAFGYLLLAEFPQRHLLNIWKRNMWRMKLLHKKWIVYISILQMELRKVVDRAQIGSKKSHLQFTITMPNPPVTFRNTCKMENESLTDLKAISLSF